MKIELVRDCLDKQVIDREGRKIGRVDGIVIETGGQGRPQVLSIEIGATTLARRLPRWLSKWLSALIRKLSGSPDVSVSATWSKVKVDRNELIVDIDSEKSDARLFEHFVRNRIITRIPGA
jgi:hypothetical protein